MAFLDEAEYSLEVLGAVYPQGKRPQTSGVVPEKAKFINLKICSIENVNRS